MPVVQQHVRQGDEVTMRLGQRPGDRWPYKAGSCDLMPSPPLAPGLGIRLTGEGCPVAQDGPPHPQEARLGLRQRPTAQLSIDVVREQRGELRIDGEVPDVRPGQERLDCYPTSPPSRRG